MSSRTFDNPAASLLGSLFPGLQKKRISDPQDERVKAEQDRRILRPAHEFLEELAAYCGAPLKTEQLGKRMCSFWIKKHEEIGVIPCLATIELICCTGNVPNVHIAAGPDGKQAIIYLYRDGHGSIESMPGARYGYPKVDAVHNFQFL